MCRTCAATIGLVCIDPHLPFLTVAFTTVLTSLLTLTLHLLSVFFFFFNDTATTEIYTLSLHDALPICSINARLYGKYLAFFIYLSAVLLIDLLRFCVLTLHPNVYAPLYWYTQFLHAGIGYAVILEIYRQTLNNSPGVARIARTFLWGVLAAVLLRVTWNAVSGPVWSPGTTSAELERDLRTVQAILLAGIIPLIAYYVVSTGKNLKGITFRYNPEIYPSVGS